MCRWNLQTALVQLVLWVVVFVSQGSPWRGTLRIPTRQPKPLAAWRGTWRQRRCNVGRRRTTWVRPRQGTTDGWATALKSIQGRMSESGLAQKSSKIHKNPYFIMFFLSTLANLMYSISFFNFGNWKMIRASPSLLPNARIDSRWWILRVFFGQHP